MNGTDSRMSQEKLKALSTDSLVRKLLDSGGMAVVFLALFGVFSYRIDRFCSLDNMVSLGLQVSSIGIVACTMLFCLASGDFDLSIGSVYACSGVLAAVVANQTGSVLFGLLAGILIGGLVGLVNGIVIAKFQINALITTLATMQIVRGLAYLVGKGQSVSASSEKFTVLGSSLLPLGWLLPGRGAGGTSGLEGIPTPVLITVFSFVLFGFLLRYTTFGRNTLAMGGNKEAARLAGINVSRLQIIIFTMQGLMAGFAGAIMASRMGIGDPKVGVGFELQVISACVLGGVSLKGGIGSMTFVVSGVLIMGAVENAMNLKNLDPFFQYIVRGGILLAAVLFDRFKQRRAD